MAKVREGIITQAAPSAGQQVAVEAIYTVESDVIDTLGRTGLRSALSGTRSRIKSAISGGVGRAYVRSGLRRITNQLWNNATQNFSVFVSALPQGSVQVRAVWNEPTIPYFFAQLFGSDPHNIPNAFGRGQDFGKSGRFGGMFHPGNDPHAFIQLDGQTNRAVGQILNDAVGAAFKRVEAQQRQAPAGRAVTRKRRDPKPITFAPSVAAVGLATVAGVARATRAVRTVTTVNLARGIKLSRFRVRRTLRQSGFNEAIARAMEPILSAKPDTASSLAAAIVAGGIIRQGKAFAFRGLPMGGKVARRQPGGFRGFPSGAGGL